MNIERWHQLMQSLGLPPSDDCYLALYAAYSNSSRHYHSTEHIDAMLRHLDETSDWAEHPHEVELAIWFHDAIYKPFSSSNEEDSAKWARSFLDKNNYSEAGIERVYDLIMATVHGGEVINPDEQLIVDIDLTVLGAPEHVYHQFEVNIRKEYRWVPGFIYRKKRKQLLKSFLHQKHIYNLSYFREQFEAQARINLSNAIDMLQ